MLHFFYFTIAFKLFFAISHSMHPQTIKTKDLLLSCAGTQTSNIWLGLVMQTPLFLYAAYLTVVHPMPLFGHIFMTYIQSLCKSLPLQSRPIGATGLGGKRCPAVNVQGYVPPGNTDWVSNFWGPRALGDIPGFLPPWGDYMYMRTGMQGMQIISTFMGAVFKVVADKESYMQVWINLS